MQKILTGGTVADIDASEKYRLLVENGKRGDFYY